MTTAIVHGDPGSYKTSSLVNDYLVPAVKSGRVVVTNIRGVKTPQEISDIYKFPLHPDSQIITVDFNEEGFNLIARFFHWAPLGALILMDEGQRVYPTRLRNFNEFDNPANDGRPKTVEDAFDSHRHMNWDIYISTPNISKIHKEIRAVAEFGFRHKNLATVFSFLNGRYKRVVHNAENSGAALSNVISSTLKKMDKRCFDVYESTATGKTKDVSSSVSLFKQPKVLLLLLVILYSFWNIGSTLSDTDGLPAIFGGTSKLSAPAPVSSASPLSSPAPASVPAGDGNLRPNNQNPFLGSSFFFVGEFNNANYFQVQFPDKATLTFNEWELNNIGFIVARLNRNAFKFTFGDQQFYVFNKPAPYVDTQAQVQMPEVSAIN